MANNKFYGYAPKKDETTVGWDKGWRTGGNRLDKINPYEFRKGMDYELTAMGVSRLQESTPEEREKATETVIKNLKDVPAYYSYYEHYEATTRNMDRKPSFKTFLKELEGHSMKEIGEKFTEDKMKEIKLRESIRTEVRNKINELFKIK